jgi:hypothetical protein
MRMFGMWIGLMRMVMCMMVVSLVLVMMMVVTIQPTCAATETIA